MKLVMTLLVSDEVDLVEHHLDYHLAQGVDFAIVTINRGPPELASLVEPYVDRGVASVIHEPSHTFAQAEWVTRMARLARTEHGADWVINSDADEFYWPEAGSLKEIFALIPEEYGLLPIPVCHFPPRPIRSEDGFFVDRMTVRETRSMKPRDVGPFFKTAHRGDEAVEVGWGNHKVFGTGLRPVPGWQPIIGLHFPVRSYEQFERKVVTNGQPAANNPEAKAAHGKWLDLYGLYQAGGLRDEYETRVLDPSSEAAGLRDGRLVVDARLRGWFRAHRRFASADPSDGEVPARQAGEAAIAEDAGRTERLRAEMMRAIYVGAREPAVMERDALEAKTAFLEAKRAALEAKVAWRDRKLAEYRRKHAKARARLGEAKSRHAKARARLGEAKSRGRLEDAKAQAKLVRSGRRPGVLQLLRGRVGR